MDTNVLTRLFAADAPCRTIRQALLDGHLEWALSNEIITEYEEIITRFSGAARWERIWTVIESLRLLHGNVVHVAPSFRFRVIADDPDDNKFVDCAIAAEADFIITEDRHFRVLAGAGYRPQPITPQEFVRLHL